MENSKGRMQSLLPTAVAIQRKRPSQRDRTALLCSKFYPANLWGNELDPGIHRNNGNVPEMFYSLVSMHFNLKSFDRRLIMQGKYVDKPWQKHAESLQELIIPGQEKKSLMLTPRKSALNQGHWILPAHRSLSG